MPYARTLRFTLAPLTCLVLACGGSSTNFDEPGTDTSTTDDTLGSDGTSSDTSGTDSTTSADSTNTDTTPIDAASCPGTVCGALCTDLKTDPKNCGTCGKEVCHNEACAGGAPVCAGGLRPCGGATGCLGCKNLNSDPANCGACGKACASTEVCMPGSGGAKCVTATTGSGCSGTLTRCPATGSPAGCVDLNKDITNCGACGKNCSPGEYCVTGVCTPYVSAPGCSSCPCVACKAPTDKCCRYTDGTVCSSKCIPG